MPSPAATRRSRVVPLVAGLLAAGAAASPASAQSGTPPATIDACYVPASGTIYRINTAESPAPGAPSKCLSTLHVQFRWNQQGPKGDPGAGLSDFSVSNVEVSPPLLGDPSQRLRSVRAECPPGKMAIGGNYAIFAVGGNYTNGIVPVSSGLANFTGDAARPPNVFFVITVDQPGYASTPFYRVQAFCARAP